MLHPRNYIYPQETPNPGSYRSSGFLDDLQKQRSSYGFRDSSRVKSASHQKFERTGKTLLPGAYMHNDFLSDSAKKKTTFGFKAIQRDEGPKIGHGYLDKVSFSPIDRHVYSPLSL